MRPSSLRAELLPATIGKHFHNLKSYPSDRRTPFQTATIGGFYLRKALSFFRPAHLAQEVGFLDFYLGFDFLSCWFRIVCGMGFSYS